MIYKGAFRDIIYPAQNREPRATRYRIVLAKHSRLVRAVVHLVSEEPTQPQRTDLVTALDVILNRIIEAELMGVRHDCVRLVTSLARQWPISSMAQSPRLRPRSARSRSFPSFRLQASIR